MDEVANTIFKMSPPVLLMLGINAVILSIHKLIPDKYLTIICVAIGGAMCPLLIPETSLIYSVPSPRTALVLVGVLFGACARGLHTKIKAKLTAWGWIYDEDTTFYRRLPEKPLPPIRGDGEPVGEQKGE